MTSSHPVHGLSLENPMGSFRQASATGHLAGMLRRAAPRACLGISLALFASFVTSPVGAQTLAKSPSRVPVTPNGSPTPRGVGGGTRTATPTVTGTDPLVD